MNTAILLKSRPEGKPTLDNFDFVEIDTPEISDGHVLLKTKYVSVDPYLRGRMRDEKSYIDPFQLDKPVQSCIIAEVVETQNSDFKKGDYVSTPPYEIHALRIGPDGNQFVVFSEGTRGGLDYEKDTFRVPSIIKK